MNMQDNIHISDKIDRYILNQMKEDERNQFEQELVSNPELNNELILQKEIVLATQRLHLKHHLKNIECQAREKRKRTIKRTYLWSIAASIICICIIGLDLKYSSDIRNASTLFYTETGAPLARSGNEVDNLLIQVYQYIGENNLEAASSNIITVIELINQELNVSATTEEEIYKKQILTLQKQDAEWYNALILMKQGRIYNSYKVLSAIANSDSRYADKARILLETSYSF